jgi:hypothetical protein
MTEADKPTENTVAWTSLIEMHRAFLRDYADAQQEQFEEAKARQNRWADRVTKVFKDFLDAYSGKQM